MSPMTIDILMKAAAAAAFFFVLQSVVLNASVVTGLQWAAVAAVGAGYIAWSQWTRR